MVTKPLVIIPARAGSKGLPGKNTRPLSGKPLIQFTIEAALEVFDKDQIVVSTDDLNVVEIARNCGLEVPFMRPSHLATDTAGARDVILHVLDEAATRLWHPEMLVLLQPTSPLRNEGHLREALALYRSDLDMVVSVKASKSNPYFNAFEEDKEGFLVKTLTSKAIRRQDCPVVYEYNGAIYLINTHSIIQKEIGAFSKVIKYQMSDFESVDIDTAFDFLWAEFILRAKMANQL